MQIADRSIGPGHPCFIIAEVAQAHDGSLGLAHSFVDAAADAGADAVKFQTHIAAAESTQDDEFRIKFSRQDATRYDYWQRMEFSAEQWAGLAKHAHERGMCFLSSAFSPDAVRILEAIGMPAWKIASGETSSRVLIDQMASTGRPFIVSTGMSDWAEIDAIADQLHDHNAPFALLQCTSKYPTPLEDVGLNVIDQLRDRYACPAGLSDHSGSVHPAYAALARGADILELHITLDRRMFGPDTVASLTVTEFAQVTAFRDALATMDTAPVDKDVVAAELEPLRRLFVRSLAPARALSAGECLTSELIVTKKPGTGIPPIRKSELIGRTVARDVPADRLFCEEDFR